MDTIKKPCPPKDGRLAADIIFTDYYGLSHLRKKAIPLLQHYKYVLLPESEIFLLLY